MPLELGIWRIDEGLSRMQFSSLEFESRLEDILHRDITIAAPNWLVIGRQVATDYGKYIDLLAIDPDGNLVVIELKRDKTSRDIVAQSLDYGSWVRDLRNEDVARVFDEFNKKYHPEHVELSINEAFCKRFNVKEMPDELNESHELVIVASSLDESTERIVRYLAEEYEVRINAIFFRAFRDDDREYLSRAWLNDPTTSEHSSKEVGTKEAWNGEYYVSFGDGPRRCWEEAVKYGFISAGGGRWYSNTLNMLEPGARIWVNVPSTGYVGVGRVIESAVRADAFELDNENGDRVPASEILISSPDTFKDKDNDELAEFFVRVDWDNTVSLNKAIKETGFFGNQNSAARPRAAKWLHTVERLKKRFVVE
ncbi:MAG: DUF91 domain-containing protein [Planctomycetaceae bacterium]|nr:DUF91 domain-containing protein [Planctomycetaceae bacterium]